jgi:hypothetical protein
MTTTTCRLAGAGLAGLFKLLAFSNRWPFQIVGLFELLAFLNCWPFQIELALLP